MDAWVYCTRLPIFASHKRASLSFTTNQIICACYYLMRELSSYSNRVSQPCGQQRDCHLPTGVGLRRRNRSYHVQARQDFSSFFPSMTHTICSLIAVTVSYLLLTLRTFCATNASAARRRGVGPRRHLNWVAVGLGCVLHWLDPLVLRQR